MATKRIFVSQPMRGRSDSDIEEERQKILQLVKEIEGPDISLMPSFFKGRDREMLKPLRMLGMALELLSDADIAVFAPGWETGRGCKIEHECAVQYGVRVIDLRDGQQETEK